MFQNWRTIVYFSTPYIPFIFETSPILSQNNLLR